MTSEIGNSSVTKRGRPEGSRNRRTVLGQDFLKSLDTPAKRRLKRIIEDSKDEKVVIQAIKLHHSYRWGAPVTRKELSGPNGGPIEHLTSASDLFLYLEGLAKRHAAQANGGQPVNGGALDSQPAMPAIEGQGAGYTPTDPSCEPSPVKYENPSVSENDKIQDIEPDPVEEIAEAIGSDDGDLAEFAAGFAARQAMRRGEVADEPAEQDSSKTGTVPDLEENVAPLNGAPAHVGDRIQLGSWPARMWITNIGASRDGLPDRYQLSLEGVGGASILSTGSYAECRRVADKRLEGE